MKHKNIINIISIIPAILMLLIATNLCKTNYANNSLFNFIHIIPSKNKISYSEAQKSASKTNQKSFICNIEKTIDSQDFLDLLTYLKKSGAKRIIIEGKNNFISKYNKLDEINELFATEPELFIETRCWDNAKTLRSHNNDDDTNSLFAIRTHFAFSHTAANQPVSNLFNAKKVHFCPYTKSVDSIQDFIFRLEKKYVVTLPFALLAAKYNMKISDLRFEEGKVQINDKTFYYDAQGRFAFKRGFVSYEKPQIFSASNMNEIDFSDAFVFICNASQKISEEHTFDWISTVLGQLQLLEKSDSMIFLPTYISILLTLLMFTLMFILTVWIKHFLSSFLVLCICFLGNFLLYFFTANFWNLNYPLAGCIFLALTGFICAIVTLFCRDKLWQIKVFKIFRYSASIQLQKNIAHRIAKNELELSSKKIKTAFIQCEISNLHSNNKDSEEYLIHKNEISENVENIIRKNNAVNCSHLCGYYSELFSDNQTADIFNTITQLNQRAFGRNLTIALHYNDEYFSNTKHAYDEKKSFEEYKPLGESLLVTNKMLKNAKKFNAKIIISENMMKVLIASGQNIHIRQLDKVKIKNSTFCQRLFEVIPEEDFKQKKQIIEYFHCGQKLFEQRKWKEASEYFSRCLKIDKTDMSAAIYLQRCRNFISSSPKEDWNGVYEID